MKKKKKGIERVSSNGFINEFVRT